MCQTEVAFGKGHTEHWRDGECGGREEKRRNRRQREREKRYEVGGEPDEERCQQRQTKLKGPGVGVLGIEGRSLEEGLKLVEHKNALHCPFWPSRDQAESWACEHGITSG